MLTIKEIIVAKAKKLKTQRIASLQFACCSGALPIHGSLGVTAPRTSTAHSSLWVGFYCNPGKLQAFRCFWGTFKSQKVTGKAYCPAVRGDADSIEVTSSPWVMRFFPRAGRATEDYSLLQAKVC